jgi:hypothetical protein
MLYLFPVARPGEASRGISGTLGRKERGEYCGYFEVSMWQPSSVLVKDRAILTPMASLELCTDCMLDFMGLDKPSNFCNYYVEPHLPGSYDAFTFGGKMRSRAKTSSWEQGPDFDIVETYE